ncbi:hypothetical protein [Gandjariella thermophila]|uniref:Endonuclease/exonuclease/phosphatase domain-containing protein n=1 Tax=Gandjariella thermophila TaxID=1931992 RepID=A0A4D4J9N7_9PSEU|nr:hypothetical protein [Gandjariella thermophila]GDY33381.1 hypothetical protein GTS_50140 [Gandjariella thermophila]
MRRIVPLGRWVLLVLVVVFGVLGDAPAPAEAPPPAVAAGTAAKDFRLATPSTQVLPARVRATGRGAVSRTFRELQLNLCHGGIAPCGDDSTLPEIDALLRQLSGSRTPPDLITLNEVCRDDIARHLASSMADVWPADKVFFLFAPAVDGNRGGAMAPYPCADGDAYGNAVIGHVPDAQYHGLAGLYGTYTAQTADPEKRSFGCLYLARHYYACTTHLEVADRAVAMRQCVTLMIEVIPFLAGHEGGNLPTVVGADLNLRDGAESPQNVRHCVPAGYHRAGDGDVMHVMVSGDIGLARTDRFPLRHTDHNAFLVTMTMP